MKRLVLAAVLALATGSVATRALAQEYPSRPIRILIGFTPGGPSDAVYRVVGNDMSPRLGQTMIIENRPGATGMISMDALRASPPDGYTLAHFTTSTLVAQIFADKVPPNPATAYTPLGYVWDGGVVVTVNPAAPYMANVHTLADLVAVAKANPGKLNYSSSGTGGVGHLIAVMLAQAAGIDWTHIAHKGTAPGIADMMAGRISFMMSSVPNEKQLIKEGKIRQPVVSSAAREARYPDVPSIVEAGYPDLVVTSWAGLAGPAGLPKPIADRLSNELRTTMNKAEVRTAIGTIVPGIRSSSAEEFGQRYVKDYSVLARAIKQANIKVE